MESWKPIKPGHIVSNTCDPKTEVVLTRATSHSGLLQKALIVTVDAALAICALLTAYQIRFDFSVPSVYTTQLTNLLPVVVLIRVTGLYYTRSYQFSWRYASVTDLIRVFKAVTGGLVLLALVNYFRNYPLALLLSATFFVSTMVHRGFIQPGSRGNYRRWLMACVGILSLTTLAAGFYIFTVVSSAPTTLAELPLGAHIRALDFKYDLSMPRGVLIMESILSFLLLGGFRVGPRLAAEVLPLRRYQGRRTLILGAGDMGESILRALKKDRKWGYMPVGFVDDDPSSSGSASTASVCSGRERTSADCSSTSASRSCSSLRRL